MALEAIQQLLTEKDSKLRETASQLGAVSDNSGPLRARPVEMEAEGLEEGERSLCKCSQGKVGRDCVRR